MSLRPPPETPFFGNPEFLRAQQVLDRAVHAIIAERRRGETGDDLLSMLLEARDEDTGEGMDDRQLRDEVMTMFLAGHETTANALSWTYYLLGKHPEVARRMRAELAAVLGGRRRAPVWSAPSDAARGCVTSEEGSTGTSSTPLQNHDGLV